MSPMAKTSRSDATARGRTYVSRLTTAAISALSRRPRKHCTSAVHRARIERMFLTFFANLRQAHVPVTPREYLDLMRALEGDLAKKSVDEFYRLSRALLVKDERNLDKFDVVFAQVFRGALTPPGV